MLKALALSIIIIVFELNQTEDDLSKKNKIQYLGSGQKLLYQHIIISLPGLRKATFLSALSLALLWWEGHGDGPFSL